MRQGVQHPLKCPRCDGTLTSVTCDHKRASQAPQVYSDGKGYLGKCNSNWDHRNEPGYRDTCAKCGAQRIDSQIGLESTIESYVATMVEVFGLVREVLADDGTCWINLGGGYQDKQMDCAPWRVAMALQADGWYLRSDIIWAKPNPMPESCTDRPTKSHEYLFLLAKRPTYFFDSVAIREPAEYGYRETKGEWRGGAYVNQRGVQSNSQGNGGSNSVIGKNPDSGRNRRSVWTIPTQPFSGAHFACFPEKLVEPCILASTSARGHCPAPGCGKRWVRVVERSGGTIGKSWHDHSADLQAGMSQARGCLGDKCDADGKPYTVEILGWKPGCTHNLEPVPDVCLDIFHGSGTVGMVCERLGRDWLGIELNADYVKLQEQRMTGQVQLALW